MQFPAHSSRIMNNINRIKLVFSCWIKVFQIIICAFLLTSNNKRFVALNMHRNDFGWHVPVCWLLECALYLQLHKLNWQIIGLKKKRRIIIFHYSCGVFWSSRTFMFVLLLLPSWSSWWCIIILRFISKILYEDLQWCHHVWWSKHNFVT